MKILGILCAISWLAAILLPGSADAVLRNHGPAGEYFYDTETALYWCDPEQFVGWSRPEIDALVTSSPIWNWAQSSLIEGLNGQSSEGGAHLEEVMGPRQFTLGDGGPRWIGFYVQVSQPNGWIAQSYQDPGWNTITDTGWQHQVENWTHGAWLVSTVDPNVIRNEQVTWGKIKSLYWEW
jgi:hypothetical protein